jgi:hypothetical protein
MPKYAAVDARPSNHHLGVIIDRAIVILKTVPVAGQPYLNSLGDPCHQLFDLFRDEQSGELIFHCLPNEHTVPMG